MGGLDEVPSTLTAAFGVVGAELRFVFLGATGPASFIGRAEKSLAHSFRMRTPEAQVGIDDHASLGRAGRGRHGQRRRRAPRDH
jgi:hypothetical protein